MQTALSLAGIGAAIEALRRARGWSGDELAGRCDINPSYLHGVERGERNPTCTTLVRISMALDVPSSQLLREAESRTGAVGFD